MNRLCPSPLSMVLFSFWMCSREVLSFLLFSLSIFDVPLEGCAAFNIFSHLEKIMGPRVVLSLKYFKAHISGVMVFYYYGLLKHS